MSKEQEAGKELELEIHNFYGIIVDLADQRLILALNTFHLLHSDSLHIRPLWHKLEHCLKLSLGFYSDCLMEAYNKVEYTANTRSSLKTM